MATARSCSTSGLERPIEWSSSVTAMRRSVRRFGGRADRVIANVGSSWVDAHRHRAGVRIEPLRLAERNGGGSERAQLIGATFEDRRALHKIEHAQSRRETGRARGGQHVVAASHVIADRLRSVSAEKDRSDVAYAAGKRFGSLARDFEMLRRNGIH